MEFLLCQYVRHCAKLCEVLNERVFVGGHTSNTSKALIPKALWQVSGAVNRQLILIPLLTLEGKC